VKLVVNNDTTHPVTKSIMITPGAERLAGISNWYNGYFTPTDIPIQTAHGLNDTTFAITVINDTAIMVWGEVLPFFAPSNSYTNYYGNGYLWNDGVQVTYTPGSINFAYRCCGAISAYTTVIYSTP